MNLPVSIFACPPCAGALRLQQDGQWFWCAACSKRYPVVVGIPVFKSGLYLAPVVRVRNLSRADIEEKMRVAQTGKYYKDFAAQANGGFEKYLPAGIIERELLDGIVQMGGISESNLHLDWATGRGGLLRRILSTTKVQRIVTLDLDIQECAALRKWLDTEIKWGKRVTVVCGDTRSMPFRSGVFASASTLWGLDEQRQPDRAIAETYRVVKKRGSVTLSGGMEDEAHSEMNLKLRYKLSRRIEKMRANLKKAGAGSVREKQAFYQFSGKRSVVPVISYILSARR